MKPNDFNRILIVSVLNSLLSSTPLRNIIPLWHAKETREDHFQIECTIIGWEFYANSSMNQFVLSSHQTSNHQEDFMDLSIGDRITALSRKYIKNRPINV